MAPHRVFLILAIVLGLAFVAITPPFRAPDEVTHFWRPVSMAYGTLIPKMTERGPVAPLPKGYQTFVFVFRIEQKPDAHQYWLGWVTWLAENERVELPFVASYTPVAYAPQLLAAGVARVLHLRPMVTFYLGRLANLAAYIALIYWALRITPVLRWGLCAIALLPMSLFLAASWSPDAMTIGMALLLLALILRGARAELAALVAGLCKPGYFVLSFLSRRWTVIAAAFAGALIATFVASGSYVSPHGDPHAQWLCVKAAPFHFLAIALRDYGSHGLEYLEQAIGRLGLLDIPLPVLILILEAALLIAVAEATITLRTRITASVIALVLAIGTSLTLYLMWTPVCADNVQGIQGRYFIPMLPLVLLAIARTKPLPRIEIAVVAVAVIGNAAGLLAVAQRFHFS